MEPLRSRTIFLIILLCDLMMNKIMLVSSVYNLFFNGSMLLAKFNFTRVGVYCSWLVSHYPFLSIT